MKKIFLSSYILTLALLTNAMDNNPSVELKDNENIVIQLLGRTIKKDEKKEYDPKHYFQSYDGTLAPIDYSIEMPLAIVKQSTTLYNNIMDSDADEESLIIIGNTIKGVCSLSLAITLDMMKKINQKESKEALSGYLGKLRKRRYLLMLVNTASYLNCDESIFDLYATTLLQKIDRLATEKNKLRKALKFCKLLADNDQYGRVLRVEHKEDDLELAEESVHKIQANAGPANSVCFTNDGKNIITGSDNIKIWNAQTGELISTLGIHKATIVCVCCSPKENRCASGSDDTKVRIWDLDEERCLFVLKGHEGIVQKVNFSPDGSKLASCSGDTTIRIWDVSHGNCLQTILGHKSEVHSVCFSSIGSKLVSCSRDKTIKMWDLSDSANIKCCYTLDKPHGDNIVLNVCFSPDGTQVASTGYDQILRLWNVETGDCIKEFEGHSYYINPICFSPNGFYLLSGSTDATAKLWNVKKGECLFTLKDHIGEIYSVCFSPNGKQIASSGRKGTLCIYTFNNLKKDFTLSALTLLKYLLHNEKHNILGQLPPKPLYLEAFAQLPKVFRLRFPESFDYDELAIKLRARKQK